VRRYFGLGRGMDPNGFVRLCRKFKFMSFELGPTASKKGGDRDTKEVSGDQTP
jgi:hypothetical protein